ncbi:MAG: hypothetical protein AAFR51_16070 [Pseudomonadota bacterium]
MIRPARLSDGAQAISVLRQSITELCVDDHRGDPDILENWLRNKTVSTFEAWLTNDAIRVRVASVAMRLLASPRPARLAKCC